MMSRNLPVFLIFFAVITSLRADPWVPLFDGTSTTGWTPREEIQLFEAVDGELHLKSEKNVWVTTDIHMSDFIVELEVKLPVDAAEVGFNSGLAYRCQGDSGKPTGYQCEIDLKKPGGIYGIGLGKWLYPTEKTADEFRQRVEGLIRETDWNTFRVEARGARVKTFLNGTLIAEIEDDQQLDGFFAIQHHGKGGTVKFRNLRAKALPPESERPNILWITAEDMSPTLGCYGDTYATTPHIDALAKESVLYENAFAAAPVCSPSRVCLITGMYPVSMGTQHMRSAFPLPEGVRGFPSYIREAGYYTTNNVKTDYNNADAVRVTEESWNESSETAHWRNEDRAEGQPFFAVFNDMTSHQSRTMVWPYSAFDERVQSLLSADEVHDPEAAPVPPYYPDTQEVRRTLARYYDCVTAMDKNVGRILGELEYDGLADNTIVFFYSDHGSGMPRHKRLLHDSGMKVALMVKFPEKWQHLAPAEPGARLDRMVSFVDFPPTVMRLAGLEPADYMQGVDFFSGEEKKYVYGSRDRVDEVFEMGRSLRDKRWLYIRNYYPHLSWNQPSVFSDLGSIRKDITLYAAENLESLTVPQLAYAGPKKAAEELYDCEADPQNLVNLAISENLSEEQQAALDRLRVDFVKMREDLDDSGALPEGDMMDIVGNEGLPVRDILVGKTDHRPDLRHPWAAADLVGMGETEDFLEMLGNENPSVRFWGVMGLRNAAFEDQEVHRKVIPHLTDTSATVRIETADWLSHFSDTREVGLTTLVSELGNQDWWIQLRACRAIELHGERARSVMPVMRELYDRTRNETGDANFYLAFSTGAFLEKLGEPTIPWNFHGGETKRLSPTK